MSDRRGHEEILLPNTKLKQHADDILQHLHGEGAQFALEDKNSGYHIELSEELYVILRNVLIDLSQNRAVQILPRDMIFTTVQAAEFLQVSRPFLIGLIEKEIIPCQMVGTHRRIKLVDLIEYKNLSEERGRKARENLTKMAEELKWGY